MTIVTKSKGMQKSPDFHALYGSIVTKSKGMQKISKISRNIWPYSYQIKRYAKKSSFSRKLKHPNSKCSKLYFYSKRFRFAPLFNYSAFIKFSRYSLGVLHYPFILSNLTWGNKSTRKLWLLQTSLVSPIARNTSFVWKEWCRGHRRI